MIAIMIKEDGARATTAGHRIYSIQVADSPSLTCADCGQAFTGGGPVGHRGEEPLCDYCLFEGSPQLGMVMALISVTRACAAIYRRVSAVWQEPLWELGAFANIYECFAAKSGPARLFRVPGFEPEGAAPGEGAAVPAGVGPAGKSATGLVATRSARWQVTEGGPGVIAEALRLLRTRKGLTQSAASKSEGAPDFRTLSHWETGRKQPTFKLLRRYLTSLGFDLCDLQQALHLVEGTAPKRLQDGLERLTRRVTAIERHLMALTPVDRAEAAVTPVQEGAGAPADG